MVYEKDVLLVFNEAVIYSFSFKSINIYDKKNNLPIAVGAKKEQRRRHQP